MVPRNDFDGFDQHNDAFGSLRGHHRTRLFVERPVIALHDQFAEALDVCDIIVNDRLPLDLHAAQLFITLTALSKAGETWVASKIDRLLRFAIGPEDNLALVECVPHGDQVRISVMINGRDLEGALLLQERLDLYIGHGNEVAAAHTKPPLAFSRFTVYQ